MSPEEAHQGHGGQVPNLHNPWNTLGVTTSLVACDLCNFKSKEAR